MKDIKLQKEELDTNFDEIRKAEKIWGVKFPEEYSEFLLKNNGGVADFCYPTIGAENNAELREIERFLSIGDIILQKKYLMSYTLNDEHDDYDLAKFNLKKENLLTFAIAEAGCYYLDLAGNGQLYFCNYSGGDGIVRVNTKSFKEFINSLEFPSWYEYEEDSNSNVQLKKECEPFYKIKKWHLFETPDNPKLGFERFKEVFEVLGDIEPWEDEYSQIANFYVYDRLKIEYLMERGCRTDGLLCNATNIETINYLVEEKGLDINKRYKDRYPLQKYLIPNLSGVKSAYLLISELLEYGIELDWSVIGEKSDGTPDLPMLKKLELLNKKYWENEISDKKFWSENGSPNEHVPFKRCQLIEEKIRAFKEKENER